MIDNEREEAKAIILKQQAENAALKERLKRCENQGPIIAGNISNSPLCLGCYRWRIGFGMIAGFGLGLITRAVCDDQSAWLKTVFDNPDNAALSFIIAASLLPLALIVLDWKIRLYKNGYPGVIRFMANMLAEGKRGLRHGQ